MTILDSIKYPISDPPTEKELEVLPEDIFDKIRRKILDHIGFNYETMEPEEIAIIMYNQKFLGKHRYQDNLSGIRKIIYEHDNL